MVRRGVSLIEVLFAIGVVAVGLLGVIAVIPVGMRQAGKADVTDRAARLGLNALEEFELRGYADPRRWRQLSTSTPPVAGPVVLAPGRSILPPGQSYAIDPRFLALTGNQSDPRSRWFPYTTFATGPAVLCMPRVTLSMTPSLTAGAMTAEQADAIFLGQDDLVFDLPKDKSLPPAQNYVAGSRREYEGTISWMATAAPRMDQSGQLQNLYILSIVVFHRRDSALMMDAVNERVATIPADLFHSAGITSGDGVAPTGGDVTIVQHPGSTNPAEDLEVKVGNWVMLARLLPPVRPATAGVPLFRWYRVISADPDSELNTATNLWQRDVTLEGPDWPVSTNYPTQVVIVSNVVAVYEKTIRLESSSLWNY